MRFRRTEDFEFFVYEAETGLVLVRKLRWRELSRFGFNPIYTRTLRMLSVFLNEHNFQSTTRKRIGYVSPGKDFKISDDASGLFKSAPDGAYIMNSETVINCDGFFIGYKIGKAKNK